MRISLTDAGKRFNRDWVFRHVDMEFTTDRRYALTGSNGSGKSTLLQLIGGIIDPSEGKASIGRQDGASDAEDVFPHLSFCAPYLELVEEMTGEEFLEFHRGFKPYVDGLSAREVLERTDLSHAAAKQIRYYSSGMRQRLKLAQSVLSDTTILLLDEPCTNLDEKGVGMYRALIEAHSRGRIVVIASNDTREYQGCDEVLNMERWKPGGGATQRS
jgi:ABC-type multidrug transport system ATPase subunit